MSSRDNKKVEQLLKLNVLPGSWKKELESMRESGYKSEIQIILTDPRRKAGHQEKENYNRNTHNPLLFYLRTKIKPVGDNLGCAPHGYFEDKSQEGYGEDSGAEWGGDRLDGWQPVSTSQYFSANKNSVG
ncbi:hypothetical protein VP01_851g6 [Puccinia sorghi]|uniref:Uncharacterized protein n=1 Tax=Puccinia sorghi TaxID=27349 RepID=A0A0L6U940_9BASI|nr:hypothetical protein VP01_851g6 [Puccinia sorghi]